MASSCRESSLGSTTFRCCCAATVIRSSSTSTRCRRSCRSRRSSYSTGTRPRLQADLSDHIDSNKNENRKRGPQETVGPAMATAVLCPYVPGSRGQANQRDGEARLEEAV